jgi:uncharacterized protein YbgA (DUF1722 family)/uncharacterized protein YbbK (DUF523 family)
VVNEPVRPVVVVSKCLGFVNCRYNGAIITDEFVRRLCAFVDFVPVCAEVEVGLGVPRDPVRVVEVDGKRRLEQPATGKDLTEAMQAFARSFLDSHPQVHGFILKSRSPSCGIKDVRVYGRGGNVLERSSGLFGGAVLEHFPLLPIEDEARLSNLRLREHFLTRLYALARFSQVRARGAMRDLVQFHAQNKLLLMAYSQKGLRLLGRIVANLERQPAAVVLADYEEHLLGALAAPPRHTAVVNVLMHALGYFKGLSSGEKDHFLDTLQKYRRRKVPMSVPLILFHSWIIRFGEPYLEQQTFMRPYPEELVELSGTGKGRDH